MGLRAGVAGAGVFGGHHARKYAALEGVAMAAVYDHVAHAAERLARPLGAEAFDDVARFLDAVDVVTVATPADSHATLAAAALRAGKHVYVEKPLAITRADADSLVRLASEQGRVLACGHQERVVFAAMGLMDLADAPTEIEAVRRGLPSERNRDVSCVLDLMIHDLDLACVLAGSDFTSVQAEGGFDEVRAQVWFGSGLVAHFEASRIAESRERTMWLQLDPGEVEIDFLAPSFRNTSAAPLNAAFADTADGRDPLGANVAGFLDAVRGRRARPVVTGEEGARALELALAIESSAGLA